MTTLARWRSHEMPGFMGENSESAQQKNKRAQPSQKPRFHAGFARGLRPGSHSGELQSVHFAEGRELPAVRYRRIKGIEADKRKAERERDRVAGFLKAFRAFCPITWAFAKRISNDGRSGDRGRGRRGEGTERS